MGQGVKEGIKFNLGDCVDIFVNIFGNEINTHSDLRVMLVYVFHYILQLAVVVDLGVSSSACLAIG